MRLRARVKGLGSGVKVEGYMVDRRLVVRDMFTLESWGWEWG